MALYKNWLNYTVLYKNCKKKENLFYPRDRTEDSNAHRDDDEETINMVTSISQMVQPLIRFPILSK